MKLLRLAGLSVLLSFLVGSCGSSPGGGCQATWPTSSDRLLGNQAPNFSLPNLKGETVQLESLTREKPTLLVFWATWCPTCLEEIPTLNRWAEEYPELQIVGVNVQEPAERVEKFTEKHPLRYPVVLDEEAEVAHEYGLVGIPATVLLAKGGRVIYYGFALPKNIEQLIQQS
jgi:peroxiredoxin